MARINPNRKVHPGAPSGAKTHGLSFPDALLTNRRDVLATMTPAYLQHHLPQFANGLAPHQTQRLQNETLRFVANRAWPHARWEKMERSAILDALRVVPRGGQPGFFSAPAAAPGAMAARARVAAPTFTVARSESFASDMRAIAQSDSSMASRIDRRVEDLRRYGALRSQPLGNNQHLTMVGKFRLVFDYRNNVITVLAVGPRKTGEITGERN